MSMIGRSAKKQKQKPNKTDNMTNHEFTSNPSFSEIIDEDYMN